MVGAILSLAELETFDPHAPARGQERRFCCPLPPCDGKPLDASHRSLSANTETGLWHCSRCGGSGKLKEWWSEKTQGAGRGRRRLVPRYRVPAPEPDPPQAGNVNNVNISTDWRDHLRDVIPLAGTPAAAYLQQRGIPLELAHAGGARYSPSWYGRPAVVFPVRDQERNLVAAQGRYLDARAPKVRSAGDVKRGVFVAAGAWEEDPLIIVEAPVCALTLAAACFPAIALMGASNCPAWLPSACAFRRVLLALDGDAAGDNAAERLAAQLRPLGARVERLRPEWFKDWNELAPRLPDGLTAVIAAAFSD